MSDTSDKRRMLLVYPKNLVMDFSDFRYVGQYLNKPGGMLNASLATVAALTPPQFEIKIVDEMVQPIDFDEPYDLVGITGFQSQLLRAREIAEQFSKRGVLVVCGGPSVSISPERWRSFSDVLIVGEAEEIWPQFVADYLAGCHKPEYRETEKPELSLTPVPDYSGFQQEDLSKYIVGIVQTSRGCPFDCEFCDAIVYVGRRMRYKPVDTILAEVEQMQRMGQNLVFLADDNFSAGRKQAKEILRALRGWNRRQRYPMQFMTELSIDTAKDEELLELAAEAGLTQVYIGVESPSDESLTEVHKLQNVRSNMIEDIKKFQENGIMAWAGGMVGFDHDDVSIFQRQFDFFMKCGIPKTSIHIVQAPDGTPLLERIEKEGRYVDPWADDAADSNGFYDTVTQFTIVPKRMTVDQLQQGTYWLIWRLNDADHVAERLRIFFENFENSSKRKRLQIPRPRRPWNRDTMALAWRLFRYCRGRTTPRDRRAFRRMLRYASRSSHPQKYIFVFSAFLHAQNVRAMLLSRAPQAASVTYPEPLQEPLHRTYVAGNRSTECSWSVGDRLTRVIIKDRAGKVLQESRFGTGTDMTLAKRKSLGV